MSRGRLLFEDMANGTIAFRADYQDGYDVGSHAHKMMNVVIAFLDEQALSKTQETALPVGGALIPFPMNGHGSA